MTSVENPMGLKEFYVGYGYGLVKGHLISLLTGNEKLGKKERMLHVVALHHLLEALKTRGGTLKEKIKKAIGTSVSIQDVLHFKDGKLALVFSWSHSPQYWSAGDSSGTEYEYGYGPVFIAEEEKDIVLTLYAEKMIIATAEVEEEQKIKELQERMSELLMENSLDEISTYREQERLIRTAELDHESITKKRKLVLKEATFDTKSLKEKRKAVLVGAGYSKEDIKKFLKDEDK